MTDPRNPPPTDPKGQDPLADGRDIGPFPRLFRIGGDRPHDFFPRWPGNSKPEPAPVLPRNLFEDLDNPPDPDPPVDDGLSAEPVSDWIPTADPHDLVEPVPGLDEARHPLHKLGRFAFPPGPPLDDAAAAASDQRWTAQVILTLTLFLAVFNAASVSDWVRQQPPGWTTSTVRGLSDVWNAQLSQLGADQPRQGLREMWDAARKARFIGQEPADASEP